MLRMDFTLSFTGTVGVGQYLLNIGSADALAPFPCHQLFTTLQATINNNTVNINCQDVINVILRSNDSRELSAYNSLTPTAFDTYYKYSDAVLANNNPNGSYVIQSDSDLPPRGAYYIDPANITGNTIGASGSLDKTVTIKVSVVEPLLISPFIFADPKSNTQGFYGVTNLNIVANLAANAHRAFRSANSYITNATVASIEKAELIFNFLTGHPSDMLPSRNCVPYYELPRYQSPVGIAVPSGGAGSIPIESPNFQLNQIPDKLFIFVRKVLSSQKVQDADAFLPIKGISINWNNNAGILSSATPYDLYRFSREAGYNGTWNEFNGQALRNNPAGGNPIEIATSGSMLMLDFGRHIQITEDWYAPKFFGLKSINPIEISI